MIDPRKFTVRQAKQMGIWPPQDHAGIALAPYIRRLKGDIEVLDIGVGKGEGIVYLHDNVKSIKSFFGLSHNADYEDILRENMKLVTNVVQDYDGRLVDVVLITMLSDTNADMLEKYYSKVKKGGIFAGNDHDQVHVKEALGAFRRKNKIGTHVNIINKTTWFWVKE